MSYTAAFAVSTCQIAGLASTEETALAVYDYLANHPDEIPLSIEELNDDQIVDCIEDYLDLTDEQLVIYYSTETTEYNYDSDVFDFLSKHFACLQKSLWMTTTWVVADSRTGYSAGTDYYDKSGERIDVNAALTQYLLS